MGNIPSIQRLASLGDKLLLGSISLLTLVTIFSFLGKWSLSFELLSHFRWHYVCLWFAGGAFLWIRKKYRGLLLVAIGVVVNGMEILPLYVAPDKIASDTEPDTLRIASINVLRSNDQYESVEAYVARMNPDVLVLMEITPAWEEGLQAMIQTFPYQHLVPLENFYGIMLLSKKPISDAQTQFLIPKHVPNIAATIQLAQHPIHLFATHPPSPPNLQKIAWRNEQLGKLAGMISAFEERGILIGDLNTTSYSSVFKRLIRESKLHDSRLGWGRQATWPARLGFAGIALDHALLGSKIFVQKREVGPNIGSDHRPIYLELLVW